MTARKPPRIAPELEPLAVDIGALKPYPGNAKRHDLDDIRASLRRRGQYRPAVVQRSTGYVLVGNGMLAAALLERMPRLAVVWEDYDDTEARKLVAYDNRAPQLAGIDDAMLLELLRPLEGDLTGTGYDDADTAALIRLVSGETDDEDDEPLGGDDLFPRVSRERIIDAAFEHYRRRTVDELIAAQTVPVPEALRQLNRLARTPTGKLLNTDTAYRVPDGYHPHRYDVPIPGKRSVREVYGRDEYLRHALGMLLDGDARITDATLLSTLAFTRNAQLAANFRPGFALLMYRRYAGAGGRALDTSTGFGGRLLGYLASELTGYVGIDPSTVTDAGNRRMASDLAPADRPVTLLCAPAEDVGVLDVGGAGSCDVAFTSPPYFGKERYSDEPTQSFARYSTGEAWRDGFLRPMLELQHAALRPGATNAVNIADVKIGSETYPLRQWTIDAGVAVGFEHVRTDEFPIGRVPGRGEAAERFEPVIVLRKP